MLSDSATTSVELVIAPPGYGKTTLLRAYAATDSGAVFVALREGTDLEAFVHGVIAAAQPAALRSMGGAFGEGRSGRELEDHVAAWLASRLRTFDGTILIDDFQRSVDETSITYVLIAAINATRGRIRWIVASRTAPRFPMGTWLSRGMMNMPVTASDLQFTVPDAAELAAGMGLTIGSDDAAAIVGNTLGWPIGVRLSLDLFSRHRTAAPIRSQTREALRALINDEVWTPLSPALREIIGAAALMPAPRISTLVEAGFPDARETIAAAIAAVPFIQEIDDDAFSIHDLFRDFVTEQMPREASATARMGSAMLAGGNAADALRLLISAGRIDDVRAALATQAFDLLETGRRSIVNAATAFLASNGLEDDGVVLVVRAANALADGSATNAANLLTRALARELPPRLRFQATYRLTMVALSRSDYEAAQTYLAPLIDDPELTADERLQIRSWHAGVYAATSEAAIAKTMLTTIDRDLATAAAPAQVNVLLGNCVTSFHLGDLTRAERYAQDAALLATDLGLDNASARAYASLFSVCETIDDTDQRAIAFARAQAAAAERAGNTAMLVQGLRSEFVLCARGGDFDGARAVNARLATFVDARVYRELLEVRLARALLHLADGETRRGEAALSSIPDDVLTQAERGRRDALVATFMICEGRRAEATLLIDRGLLAEATDDYYSRHQFILAHAYRGLCLWALNRPAQSRRAFAVDADFLFLRDRILFDTLNAVSEFPYPIPNRQALDPLFADLQRADYAGFGLLLRRLIEHDANDIELTAAEIETLREFDRFGGRAADVAAALGKSRYTVQNQIQSAIRKIGCSGRNEALAYARRRGWLDRRSSSE